MKVLFPNSRSGLLAARASDDEWATMADDVLPKGTIEHAFKLSSLTGIVKWQMRYARERDAVRLKEAQK